MGRPKKYKANTTTCKVCNDKLILGKNFKEYQLKNGNYKCWDCHYKISKATNYARMDKHMKQIKESYPKHRDKKLKYANEYAKKINPGIYGVFYNCKLVYIGESRSPNQRSKQHLSETGKLGGINNNSIISRQGLDRDKLRFKMLKFIDDTATRKKQESELIQRYRPLYNSDMYSHIQ